MHLCLCAHAPATDAGGWEEETRAAELPQPHLPTLLPRGCCRGAAVTGLRRERADTPQKPHNAPSTVSNSQVSESAERAGHAPRGRQCAWERVKARVQIGQRPAGASALVSCQPYSQTSAAPVLQTYRAFRFGKAPALPHVGGRFPVNVLSSRYLRCIAHELVVVQAFSLARCKQTQQADSQLLERRQ